MKSLWSASQEFANFIFNNFFHPRSDLRRLLYFLSFVFILIPSLAGAAQVNLAWKKSPDPDVTGYKMHYGNYNGKYQYTVNVGNSTSCTISGLTVGKTYYFAATAYDKQQNESDYSNEVSYKVPDNNNSIFADVPAGYWAEDDIYAIFDEGITKGCSRNPLKYCPEKAVSRAEMAIFLEKSINGGSFTPPSASGIFNDVPASHWAAKWIEELYDDGISTGCSSKPLQYCPNGDVTRANMAIFLLRTKLGSNYKPPPATGIFKDVPVTHWAAKWIEQIYKKGIATGCKKSPLQYCPDSPVTRAAMAVFLSNAFGF